MLSKEVWKIQVYKMGKQMKKRNKKGQITRKEWVMRENEKKTKATSEIKRKGENEK